MSVRCTPHDVEGLVDKLQLVLAGKFGGSYLLVREYSKEGVEHYHAIVAISCKPKQFQNAITRAFEGTEARGNKYIQSKTCTDQIQNALQYVCKGSSEHPNPRGDPPDVVGMTGIFFTKEKVNEWHAKYWEQSAKVKVSKDLKFATRIEHFIKINNRPLTLQGCTDAVVDFLIETDHGRINEFQVIDVARFIFVKNSKSGKHALKRHIFEKLRYLDPHGDEEDFAT